jgi:hypothetical protein
MLLRAKPSQALSLVGQQRPNLYGGRRRLYISRTDYNMQQRYESQDCDVVRVFKLFHVKDF